MEMGNVTFETYRIEDGIPKFIKTEYDTGYFSGDIILNNLGTYIFIQNVVDEEDYVASCVQNLLEKDDTLKEHVKALSVAVRTYIYHLLANRIFIIPDSLPQWQYRGIGYLDRIVQEAVKETKGEILTYLGYPIYSHVTYCTGGYTVPYEEIYFDSLEYSVVVEDPFSSSSPYYRWTKKLSTTLLCEKLGLQRIDSVKVQNRTVHLIPDTIVFFGNKALKTRGVILYRALAPALPSPLFDIAQNNDTLIFNGQGKGLLVGLPVWSSRVMAESGKTYRDILKYFYPVTEILKIDSLQ